MKTKKQKRWEASEIEVLIDLYTKKTRLDDICLILNRCKSSISYKARQLNLYMQKKWTKEEDEKLKILKENGETNRNISIIFKRKVSFINNKITELQIQSRINWDEKDDKLLLNNLDKFNNIKDAAIFLNRAINTVNFHAKRLGLSQLFDKNLEELMEFEGLVKNKPLYLILNTRYKSSEKRAKELNVEFNITRKDLLEIYNKQRGLCHYSGVLMKLVTKGRDTTPEILSIDRINSSKGYTKDNIVLCCSEINMIKRKMNVKDFLILCECISKNVGNIDLFISRMGN